jgi:hypothetical protein
MNLTLKQKESCNFLYQIECSILRVQTKLSFGILVVGGDANHKGKLSTKIQRRMINAFISTILAGLCKKATQQAQSSQLTFFQANTLHYLF